MLGDLQAESYVGGCYVQDESAVITWCIDVMKVQMERSLQWRE